MDASVIDRLADADVLVFGDVLLDRFIDGKVTRISREAPVPVLKFGAARAHPGGACNVAANIARRPRRRRCCRRGACRALPQLPAHDAATDH